MGYAHGTNWTDELIKNHVLEIIDNEKLDRMPSKSECESYYGNYALSNAISRRSGGWYKLAKELGYEVKRSDTYVGKQYEELAIKQLNNLGYKVIRMSCKYPYDMLINDYVKIDVKMSRLHKGQNGNFFTCNIDKPYSTCDIYLIYLVGDNNDLINILVIPSTNVFTNTQISIGEHNSKYYIYAYRWDYIDCYSKFYKTIS